jgi:hypothetical protein
MKVLFFLIFIISLLGIVKVQTRRCDFVNDPTVSNLKCNFIGQPELTCKPNTDPFYLNLGSCESLSTGNFGNVTHSCPADQFPLGMNGKCGRLFGPGAQRQEADLDTFYCINSVYNPITSRCDAFTVDEPVDENQPCQHLENSGFTLPHCKEPLDCYKNKCRKRAYPGERCHKGHNGIHPPCQHGFLCNLGRCVEPHSVGVNEPSDQRLACRYATLRGDSTCRNNCTADGFFRSCIDYRLYPEFSKKNKEFVLNNRTCESTKSSNRRCVPTSKDICYSNFDCDISTGSYCYKPDFAGKKPGTCLGIGTHYSRRSIDALQKYGRCRDVKDCEQLQKDAEKIFIIERCAKNCFSVRKDSRVDTSSRIGIERTGYVYNCKEFKFEKISGSSQVNEIYKCNGIEDMTEYTSGVNIFYPSLLLLALFFYLF